MWRRVARRVFFFFLPSNDFRTFIFRIQYFERNRDIYYYYYYYYYYLLQLSCHSVAVVITLVTNKNKYI